MVKRIKTSARPAMSAKRITKLSLYPLDMQTALQAALQTGRPKKHSLKKRIAKKSDH
jgi:hypothetical protein